MSVIGVDLDGVTYPYVDTLRTWLVSQGLYLADQLPNETCWEFFTEQWGMTLEQFIAHNTEAVNAGFMFRYGIPLPGALASIDAMKRAGHTIHIVTDRAFGSPGASKASTLEWLADWDIPWDGLTFARDKTVIRADLFIDDKPQNVAELRAAGVEAWLFDYGRDDQKDHPYAVHSWAEFLTKVGEHK